MAAECAEKHAMSSELRRELAETWTGEIHWDAAMADYCTFRAGGKAEALVVAANRAELESLLRWLREKAVPWKVIGRGSNLLVRSRGFAGVLIVLGGDFRAIRSAGERTERQDAVAVQAGAGCLLARMVGWCSARGLTGMEFLVGIPGSIGGALRMNAGAWGSGIGDHVESISFINRDGIMHQATGNELEFSYRQLRLPASHSDEVILLDAILRLFPAPQNEIVARCREYLRNRQERQPLGVASAGSFFKNPPGDSAGRLIDDAGLKGLSRGDAMVSPKHANFIVNTGRATADDILALMQEVQEKVYVHSGIMLEPEVQII